MRKRDRSTPAATGVKVAYLTSYYPAVSHTFIRREVVALREQGVQVKTFSIHGAHGVDVLSPVDLAEARATKYILGRSRVALARDLLIGLVRHPRAVAEVASVAVRSATGARRRLYQLFYVAEAVVLQRWLAQWGATHVHAHFGNAPADVARWTKALGNRIGGSWTWSFTMHGSTEFYAVEENGLPAKVAEADFVACISDYTRSQLMLYSDPTSWAKLHVVHCGVIPEEFLDARNDRGADDGVLTILCVGRLVEGKGQTLLLRAAQRLAAMGVPARVVLVGDGPSRASFEAEASRCGVDVCFTGAVGTDALPKLLCEADVFCLPSFAEGVPVVLMEAMASGLPVVATRITGVPELVEDGVSGYVVTAGRDDVLADALAKIARDPARAREMGAAGQAKVCEEFDIRRSAQLLEPLFAAHARANRSAP